MVVSEFDGDRVAEDDEDQVNVYSPCKCLVVENEECINDNDDDPMR